MIALALAFAFFASDVPPPVAPELGFAQSLYSEGDYYRSITEAKRYLYEHPKGESAPAAKLLIGECYLSGQQWTAAAAALEPLVSEEVSGKVGADAAFALADVRMGAADYDLAALEYRRFGEDFPDDSRAAFSQLRMGWAHLFAADVVATILPKKGRVAFTSAAREIDAIPATSPEKARAMKLASGARRLAGLGSRSPALAGALSAILPGSGQLYAGRWKDALIAFFVNGLFIGGAIESYLKGNTVAAGVLVLFEMGWYSGNIYSAVNSAHRTNNDRRGAILKDLKKDLYFQAAPLTSSRGVPDGATALFGGRF